MSEEELRREAVRRRLAGESPEQIASELGRTDRWVRKWVARHSEVGQDDQWAQERSRAPHSSPTRTPDELRDQILAARARLVANPRAQYGSLALHWELRRLGVEPIPPSRTIERVLAPGRSQPAPPALAPLRLQGVPHPMPVGVEPGTTHQVDLIGPRHLFGASSSTP